MWMSNFRSGLLVALCAAFISGSYSASSHELEGMDCPARDKCEGYRNDLTYMDRNCECDDNCILFNDCCIDALPKRRSRPPVQTDVTCLNYGDLDFTGVYVINKCSSSWNGSRQVREKCVAEDDLSDPFLAAPVTDVEQRKTYRNLACAECNNANLISLIFFLIKVACGLEGLTEAQIMGDITYSEQYQSWGLYRLNRFGNGTDFVSCENIFVVPPYLENSVRFCRSNLVSTCATNWTLPAISRQCAQYVAVIYSKTQAYKNPHCAICNHKTADDVSCSDEISDRREIRGRKRPMSFALLLDVNQSDGDQVGMRRVATPQCPSGYKYDPYFKKCRQLVCALPGHNVVNGRCVKDNK